MWAIVGGMTYRLLPWVFGVCALLAFCFVYPLDLTISSFFYDGLDFPWRKEVLPLMLHDLVHPAALTLGGILIVATGVAYAKGLGWRRWAFLLLALIIGPGLITNTLLKDNWGRARPMQVQEFGGTATYTPPFVMTNQCDKNCSFVAGDPAFGFWFHAFGYIAPRRRRKLFLAGVGVGLGYGLLRIGMGAHFFSDVLGSAVVVLGPSALLYGLMFGRRALGIIWREWLGVQSARPQG